MNEESFNRLKYWLEQSVNTENKSLSQLFLQMKILITFMRQLGIPIEEMKKVLEESDLQGEESELLMRFIETIYASHESEQRDDKKAIMTIAWMPTLDLIIKLWKCVMLAIEIESEKQQLSFIGKDGKDYQDHEALNNANEVYVRGLNKRIPRY